MKNNNQYDVIIIGGSYSGLAAGMALGRSLKKVLIIDIGQPCNRQTPHSHNFITQDGKKPDEIAALAKQQVMCYPTVEFFSGLAMDGKKTKYGFEIRTDSGKKFNASKLILATGIKDIIPEIPGYAESWGISVLHCPYCHGYEVRNLKTGILGNGDFGFEFSVLISNWTDDLTLFTNGKSDLSIEQMAKLRNHNIKIEEAEIDQLEHENGYVKNVHFKDGSNTPVKALYARSAFVQHSGIPEMLGCEINDEGYIRVDPAQKTNIGGIFACGDNCTRMRTVANAVAMGTTAGMMVNKELIEEGF
ncbi:MAG: NAD(P)/FAD-dependent oxidoreductase [Daejeonella sp.]|uniref:NAD(P)/FAD-dependent oxidoreductase n=1 Tax=Daejeonella sp. TaxID=2805397 RepID=UPI0027366679|nr:NAD(P)/FAD-dependent oxidoreductase [Daejeonella sp.]MDP3467774.1 NAD(P)/FAD-dependent oxidoreductase [Daejeonella sp.]